MRVLVDTSVWSLALRRRSRDLSAEQRACVFALRDLVSAGFAFLTGPVRQEILSGLSDPVEFNRLRDYLRDFEDEPISVSDYESAALCFNQCAARGVAASHVDMIICAVAIRMGAPIFSVDDDFYRYAGVLEIELTTPQKLQQMLRKVLAGVITHSPPSNRNSPS